MNIHKISAATIARTACLLLALTNQLLSACGKPVLPIESQTVEQLVTAGITTVAALVSWWNNNSFTAAAIQVRGRFTQVLMIFAPKSCIIQTGTKGRNFYGNSMRPQHKRYTSVHVCNKSHQTCNNPLE